MGLSAYIDNFHQKGLSNLFQLDDFNMDVSCCLNEEWNIAFLVASLFRYVCFLRMYGVLDCKWP